MSRRLATLSACLALAVAAPALAGSGLVVTGGVTLEFTQGEYGRGTGPSLSAEAYVEAEVNGFYASLYGMGTDEKTDDEVDLTLGYRGEFAAGLAYDVSYTRYSYPNDGGDCCGEVTVSLDKSLSDSLSLGLDLAWDPEARIGNAYLRGEYVLDDAWTLSATAGVYETEDAPSETEWDFGAGYAVSDQVSLDLRWYDGTDYDGYAALAVSFDTTLFGG